MAKFECVIAPDGGFPSFFFSSAYGALHQSNISLFLPFRFFHSLFFFDSFSARALFLERIPGKLRASAGTSRIVNARGRSVVHAPSHCARAKNRATMWKPSCPRRIQKRIRGPATAIVRAINYTDYARTLLENNNLKKERWIIFLDLSINRLDYPVLKNTWNIKFEIFDYSRELKL